MVGVLLAVLAGAVAAVAVLDARAKAHIAKGVIVGGVDVGGLTPEQARAKLHRALLTPLGAPIVVHHDNANWQLTETLSYLTHLEQLGQAAREVDGDAARWRLSRAVVQP